MLCSLCGRENREGAKFCDGCGGALDATVVRDAVDAELEAVRLAFQERYLVESLLGRGGMGAVYKARERALDRHVALKVVPASRNSDTMFLERFRREAKIAARLRHPRIVSVHEVGTLGGFHYFSMDYIEGSTLRAVLQRRGPLPVEDAIAVVTEICRAVAHAHGKGIIHRDLKPDNVMIDGEGDVFVLDFGLARAIEDFSLTHSGVIVGSPYYMSPEQLAGTAVDERTDIYSMGLILYYSLTGLDMFAAESITGVLAKHAANPVKDVVRTNESIPPHLQELLVSMLEEDPERRARSAREILERLTLRTIVALGMAATGQPEEPYVAPVADFSAAVVSATPADDPKFAAAAARRKARLRSLLDEM
jgi:serine/threonine protein kinase